MEMLTRCLSNFVWKVVQLVDPTPGLSPPSKKLLAQRIAPSMSVPLFRTSLLRSTRVLHGSVPNVSRTLGTLSSNKLVRVVLPSRLAFVCSRSFITPTIALAYAAAAKSASAKKGTTTAKGRTVAKKKAPAKKKIPAKKKVVSKKKKVVSKKKVVAKKKPVKAKRKKVEKPKAPRSMFVCSLQCSYLLDYLSVFKRDWLPPFKKPMGAWTKFAVEFTKERSGGLSMDLKEGLRTASTKWKNMSEEEKAVCCFVLFISERVFSNTSGLCPSAGRYGRIQPQACRMECGSFEKKTIVAEG